MSHHTCPHTKNKCEQGWEGSPLVFSFLYLELGGVAHCHSLACTRPWVQYLAHGWNTLLLVSSTGHLTGMVGTALYVSPEVQGSTKSAYNQVQSVFECGEGRGRGGLKSKLQERPDTKIVTGRV